MTAGMARPCALDLKIGRQTYEPDASAEKQRKECKKWPRQEVAG